MWESQWFQKVPKTKTIDLDTPWFLFLVHAFPGIRFVRFQLQVLEDSGLKKNQVDELFGEDM